MNKEIATFKAVSALVSRAYRLNVTQPEFAKEDILAAKIVTSTMSDDGLKESLEIDIAEAELYFQTRSA